MKRAIRHSLRTLGLLLLVGLGLAVWKEEELRRLWAVNTLFEPDRIVENFSHMDRAFLTVEVPRGDGPVSPLPEGAPMTLPPAVAQWIIDRAVTALVVVQAGEIRHESYHLGTEPQDRRISWSVAKSFLASLLGTLVADGTIPDLDVPITDLVPTLVGTAYDGATLRDVVQMTSGIAFDEDYLDYESDINRMGREIALGGTLDGFTAALSERLRPPGEAWRYVSMDTHVIGMAIREATGRDIPALLSERIIAPLGLETTPYYLADGDQVAFVLGGLNMATRDYARFGLMVEQDGIYGGQRILPEGWVAEMTAATAPTAPGEIGYGYQWWIPVGAGPGQFMAQGIYGQYLYIDQDRDLVIAMNAADRAFRDDAVDDQNLRMFRLIARSLAP